MRTLLHATAAALIAIALTRPDASFGRPVVPELVPRYGNSGQIDAMALDKTGKLLATMSNDGIYLSELHSRRMLRRFTSPGWFRTRTLGFSNDGRYLLDGRDLYAVDDGHLVRSIGGTSECRASFSANRDGRWMASVANPQGAGPNAAVILWDLKSSPPKIHVVTIRDRGIESCPTGFSPDGRRFYSDSPIVERDVTSGRLLRTLNGDYHRVIAYSTDGRYAVTASGDGARERLGLFDLRTGKIVRRWPPRSSADGIAFAGDGKTFAVLRVGSVSIADLRSSTEKPLELPGTPTAISLSRDGTLLVEGALYGDVTMTHVSNGRTQAIWTPRTLGGVVLSANGQWLAMVAGDRTTVWDLTTGQPAFAIPAACEVAVFSPDSRYLACWHGASMDAWDIASWTLFKTVSFQPVSNVDPSLLFLGSGLQVAVNQNLADASSDTGEVSAEPSGIINVLDFQTGRVGEALTTPAAGMTLGRDPARRGVAWIERDGTVRAYASGGRTEVVAKVASPVVDRRYGWAQGWAGPPYGGVSPDGHFALVAGRDRIAIHDLTDSAKAVGSIAFAAFKPAASFAGFSPDGHFAAFLESSIFGGEADTLALAELPGGRIVHRFAGHSGRIAHFTMSTNGSLLVTSSFDGTVRLWNVAQDRQIGTLFAGGDDVADWLVTDPGGSFDGTPGGWNGILWRFGGHTFDVAAPESFFNDFYDPGLLADLAAGNPPPERSIATLDRRSPSIAVATADPAPFGRRIRVRIRDAEAPADSSHTSASGARDVRLLRNGTLVKLWPGDALHGAKTATLEATVTLVAGANELSAYAFNRAGVRSAIASETVAAPPAVARKGTAFVVGIGLDHYANATFELNYARADANAFVTELEAQSKKLQTYGAVNVVSLFDGDATKMAILTALADVAKRAQPEDTVMLFFAGHGIADAGRFYVIPYDLGYTGDRTAVGEAGLAVLAKHSLSDVELAAALEPIDARAVLLGIDACNSGQALGDSKRIGPLGDRGLAQLAYDKGLYVLAAAQSYQAALESAQYGHGLLTFALVEEALHQGAAAPGGGAGRLAVQPWLAFAQRRVPELQRALMQEAEDKGIALSFAAEERRGTKLQDRKLQRPRIYYPSSLRTGLLPIARFP